MEVTLPLPSFPAAPEPSASDQVKASFEELMTRYQMVTDIAKQLIMSEVEHHESDNPPDEWQEFQAETEDHPELVYDVLSTVIDIAAEAIITLSSAESDDDESGLDPGDQLESLLRSMSDEDEGNDQDEDEGN